MSNVRAAHLTRRGILAAGGALGLGAVLAACGDDGKSGGSSGKGTTGAKSGPWTFKDDRGTTVKLDRVPADIVAFVGVGAALYDYGIDVKGVFGPTTTKDGKADVQAGDMDVSKLTVLGNAWGQFNVEKYAALAPDVLVTTMFDGAGTLWYVPDESKDKIAELAPSVGISAYDRRLTVPLQRVWALAEARGADSTARKVTDAPKRVGAAAPPRRAAPQAHPALQVMA
ncbi:ABC transporter substrate-binding protein, partial [Streptomyces sp. NPDC127079]